MTSSLTPNPTVMPAAAASASFVALPDDACGAAIARLNNYHFHSAILPDDRTVSVYVPAEYASDPSRRFPVLYLHDGQNLFDPHTSYLPGRTWRAGATADRTSAAGATEPVILVGVANTGLRRMAEYTPTRDARMGGGDGALYGRVLLEELKPWIDGQFRTLAGAQDTGLGGSSLGGLITLYLGMLHPQVFGKLAVLSPSIWWDHRSIIQYVTAAVPRPQVEIWLDIGTAEGVRHVRDTQLLQRLLLKLGWTEGLDLKTVIVPDGVHDEDAWAARFDQVLTFLVPAAVHPS